MIMEKNMIFSISLIFLFMFSFLGILLDLMLVINEMKIFIELELISFNSCLYVLIFYFDWMSVYFFFVVTLISSMVIYYSKSYMSGEIFINRFIILILLFILSMVLLIFSLNLISILLGWDGLGLVSYCLVIYYQNNKSFNSGMLTVLSNRIGDVMLLMAISWMINLGSWNFLFYSQILSMESFMFYILVLVMVAAMTKSAQIPFSAWLPAAMAAPTPVSSLVHSSTLVTAGVYLIIRFEEFISGSIISDILLLMASLTMLMAGLSANFEFDLKKIIALSTLSQLGLMMSILCLGYKNLAFFHLSTHAMFKALLFMCAGLIIHNMKNNQDIRFMGSLSIFMPLVSINFNVSNLALCGFPFLAGFYSKDLILEMVLFSNFNLVVFFFFFFSTGLTVSYTFRLLYFSLFKEINYGKIFMLIDKDKEMIGSMFSLLIMSIISGSVMNWLILPCYDMIYLNKLMKFMVWFFLLMGLMMGILISKINLIFKNVFIYGVYIYFGLMWFIPSMSVYGNNLLILNLSLKLDKFLDMGWFEKLGGMNMYMSFMSYSKIGYYLYMNSIKLMIFFFFMIYMILLMF
uniref:NADH-ubiquinone oxidoreductase chain 5 n=1 Tax=Hydropsyche simulans TaxID=763302 RepID=A0A3G1NCT4_9NEOP|nr:NADH dehydrogenase subunit 5 [Hydropsyche simulans]AUT18141.1 NADH dehydrogenase subunit 5 [Hydropsyche simulans]